jgi:branched-chain amino acid transport system permease protein
VPSFTLLAQSLLSGLFVGGLYGLLGLGLSLSWGLLRLINLAHFALAFLAAYVMYHLATFAGLNPLLALAIIVPGLFLVGVAMQAAFA